MPIETDGFGSIYKTLADGPSEDTGQVYNIVNYGAISGEDCTVAIQAAFAAATSVSGKLFFPQGTWNSTLPLVLTRRIEICGSGEVSQFRYSGEGPAIRGEFVSANAGEFFEIHDLQIRGTNLEGQSGIHLGFNGIPPSRGRVYQVLTESFSNGYGIFMQAPINTTIERCRIGGSRVGISMRSACCCVVRQNFMSYWANYGIEFFATGVDGVAARNNLVTLNTIHGNVLIAQPVLQSRAAIRLDRTSSTSVDSNYIEIILSPTGATSEVGHGVWVEGSALTQGNRILGNFFGPNSTGDAIRLTGLTSHTLIEGGSLGTYTLHDSGFRTVFGMPHLVSIDQLTGVSTTRRGWVGLDSSVVQLH